MPTIATGDVERDLSRFAEAERGMVVLANRYDGIDLPDDACRLVVLTGLPAATHLLERFLYDTLGDRRVLAERLRTRIVQGAGRCTRNAQDYAAVIMRGGRLSDFCARDETLRSMHPELQAELEFGLDNSELEEVNFLDLLDVFLRQGDDWLEADSDIRARAAEASREQSALAATLAEAAALEVKCWRALWRGDLKRAIELGQGIADHLAGDELRPYRAFWIYCAASWAAELAAESRDEVDIELARTLKQDAEGTARTLRWRPRIEPRTAPLPTATEYDERAERAAQKLRRLGIRGQGFERKVAEMERRLEQDGATEFELGLTELGELLGFHAERPVGTAPPDSAWRDGQQLWLLFEAKTEERPENPVSVSEARQAASHYDWVKAQLGWEEPARSLTALVSYKVTVDPAAAAVARETVLVEPTVIRRLGSRAIAMHREIRFRARAMSDVQLAATIGDEFVVRHLLSDELVTVLGRRRLGDG